MITKDCKFCDQKEWKSQGTFNLHLTKCELNYYRNKENAHREKNTDYQNVDKNNGRTHVHEWRMLDDTDYAEYRAIESGYDRVCIGCGDLKKKGRK